MLTKYSSSQIKVEWNDIDGQSGYQISRSSSSTGTSFFSTYSTTSGESKILTTNRCKAYYYKVRAYKTVGKSKIYGPWSTAVKYELELQAPATAEANLYGHDDVKVSWSKVSGASGYYVYYKKSTSTSYSKMGGTTKTYLKKSGLSDGVTYDFKVIPYYKISGSYYKSVNYTTTSVLTLKTVSTLKVITDENEPGTVVVSWNDIAGASGYQISKSSSKKSTYTVSTISDPDQITDTIKATEGKTYYYKVRAYKNVGSSKVYAPWSNVISYKLQ